MVTSLLRAGMVSPLLNLLSNLNASSLPDASLHTLAVLRCLSVDDLVKPRTFAMSWVYVHSRFRVCEYLQ